MSPPKPSKPKYHPSSPLNHPFSTFLPRAPSPTERYREYGTHDFDEPAVSDGRTIYERRRANAWARPFQRGAEFDRWLKRRDEQARRGRARGRREVVELSESSFGEVNSERRRGSSSDTIRAQSRSSRGVCEEDEHGIKNKKSQKSLKITPMHGISEDNRIIPCDVKRCAGCRFQIDRPILYEMPEELQDAARSLWDRMLPCHEQDVLGAFIEANKLYAKCMDDSKPDMTWESCRPLALARIMHFETLNPGTQRRKKYQRRALYQEQSQIDVWECGQSPIEAVDVVGYYDVGSYSEGPSTVNADSEESVNGDSDGEALDSHPGSNSVGSIRSLNSDNSESDGEGSSRDSRLGKLPKESRSKIRPAVEMANWCEALDEKPLPELPVELDCVETGRPSTA
ncbi:hypothetical protein BT63DRAFT_437621 [Microthyrium microscopicum]|uniref:Uncharacterized protein n=1 Tax=Microthyrium microscopicum TaxID=703497 RepID=A0A6A6UKN7_9PEZI|nr:hypothetical protein BT63DRAFT_437621 [Microthyrium microscopicum]